MRESLESTCGFSCADAKRFAAKAKSEIRRKRKEGKEKGEKRAKEKERLSRRVVRRGGWESVWVVAGRGESQGGQEVQEKTEGGVRESQRGLFERDIGGVRERQRGVFERDGGGCSRETEVGVRERRTGGVRERRRGVVRGRRKATNVGREKRERERIELSWQAMGAR